MSSSDYVWKTRSRSRPMRGLRLLTLLVACYLAVVRLVFEVARLDAPFRDRDILVTLADEEVMGQLPKLAVTRLAFKAEPRTIIQKDAKLGGEPATEQIGGSDHLLLHDAVALLLLRGSLQALARQLASQGMYEYICGRLEINTTSLFWNGNVPSRSGEVLAGPGRDVQPAGEEATRPPRTTCGGRSWTYARKQVEDHGVGITVGSKPSDEGRTDAASEGLVDFALIVELDMLGFGRLEFDGDCLARDDVQTEVDNTRETDS
ncbi:hypothetical protein FRC12_012992 [Ceratobasidium sp. 428]|nr:hypothetical protein FRC12_012992 [Ceratobasidium sp. 428]